MPNHESNDKRGPRRFVTILAFLAAGIVTAAIGLLALSGWSFERPVLASFGAHRVPMAPSTALLFVLYGVAVFCRVRMPRSRVVYWLGLAVNVAGAIVVILLLVLSYLGIRMEAERLGFPVAVAAGEWSVGYMSPLTALGFLLASMSFLASLPSSARRPWRIFLASGSASVLLVTWFIFLLAYLFGAPLLYGGTFIPPALSTVLAFALLGLVLLAMAFHPTGPSAGPSDDVSTTSHVLLLIFLSLAAGIVTIGCLYYRNYQKNFRAEVERQVSAIADLKVGELVQWRKERLGNSEALFKNAAFTALVRRFFEQPEDVNGRRQLLGWIGRFQTNSQYDRVFLLDVRGVLRLSVPDSPEPPGGHLVQDAAAVLRSGQVTFVDFYRDAPAGPIHLGILTPILDESESSPPLGVLVSRIDPATYLYPFIQRWPTPSRTAETLLVRREGGNEVVFLNELRFQKNTALTLRAPLDQMALPAARAASGRENIMEGSDYQGRPGGGGPARHSRLAVVSRCPDGPGGGVCAVA